MDKSSLKSGYIGGRVFQSVCLARHCGDRSDAFMFGALLPIDIFLGLQGVQAIKAPDLEACFPVQSAPRIFLLDYYNYTINQDFCTRERARCIGERLLRNAFPATNERQGLAFAALPRDKPACYISTISLCGLAPG
jgi:hypothetical protein